MGNYQTKPSTNKDFRSNSGKLTWASSSMQGWRSSMEDADIAVDDFLPGHDVHSAVFGVFDGHGGSEVSNCLSKYLVPALRRMIENEKEPNYELILQRLYLELDQAFSSPERLAQLDKELFPPAPAAAATEAATEAGAQGADDGETAKATPSQQPPSFPHIMTAGSTAVVVLLVDRTLYVANAGDSRAVLSRKGTAVHLTEDHKPNDPREMERITKAGWTVSGGRVGGTLNLSRALGDYEFKQNTSLKPEEYSVTADPDVRVEQLLDDQDEFLIIACDGIFEKMTWDTVVAFVRERLQHGLSLEKICSETLDECLAAIHGAPGCDNMTLQIIICPTTAGKELVQQGIEWSRTAPGPTEPDTFEITTHKNSPFVSRKPSSDAILSDDHASDDTMPPLVPIEPTESHQSQEPVDSSSDSDSASSSSDSSSSDSSSSDSSSFSSDSSSDSSLVQDDVQIPSCQLTNSPFESADSQ